MFILFVDDDIEEFELFCEALKTFDDGSRCLQALDGRQALDLLNEHLTVLPDCIFMDINMPIMGGNECLKKIKADAKLKDIPVLMYSTSSNLTDVKMCKELGAADFIVKPASFGGLVNVLKQTFPFRSSPVY